MNHLAEPFSKIFTDWTEATWAFDWLRDAVRRLQANGPYDSRLAVTVAGGARPALRLNFGGWLVLGFRSPGQSPERVELTLLMEQATWDERLAAYPVERKESRPEVGRYLLPLSVVQPLTDELGRAFEATLDFIAARFQSWRKSTRWKHHHPEIAEALFDPERRTQLLATGLEDWELRYERHLTTFGQGIAEESLGYEVEAEAEEGVVRSELAVTESPSDYSSLKDNFFSNRTFELLTDLHQSPSKQYYQEHKKEFKQFLMQPFQELFKLVAEKLPAPVTDLMETEKRIFSRILKNDYGQGGAWEFYWGAFYPKDGKRTADAQLSMWIDYQRLEFGFYIGEYGKKPRQRFLKNCRENYESLVNLLGPVFSGEKVLFGPRDEITVNPDGTIVSEHDLTWQEWLANPDIVDFDASVTFTASEILRFSRDELLNKIVDTYTRFFPLILLATKEQPIPEIETYIAEFLPGQNNSGQSLEVSAPSPEPQPLPPQLPLATIAEETGYDESELAGWVRAIKRKKQAIFYGPPGTGKTFIARQLAAHLIGGGDGFSDLVQFHPAYAYEDFIQGIRPVSDGDRLRYPMVKGRFLEFCRRAQQRQDACVLIIDEINRANLSRVFGELMYLLEYRTQQVRLAGNGEPFSIPDNVRLIGTMNTADRSIALVDHALRRRFAFLELRPNYQALRRYHQRRETGFDPTGLITVLQRLNQAIEPDYQVGISFFLRPTLAAEIEDVWRTEITPYLEEYFFDQRSSIDAFRWEAVAQEVIHR